MRKDPMHVAPEEAAATVTPIHYNTILNSTNYYN